MGWLDDFFHLPAGLNLLDVLRNQFESNSNVAELRVSCHSFGPSELEHVPTQGVTIGYTCQMMVPEKHKSIVKLEALNSTLINVVHHFHLRDRFRRVAAYVVDWQNEQNVGSKDRVPWLGTRAIEPPDLGQ
ncbi:hypothetical protein GH714_041839 [Hevea brasiliensis]|uniref:Uncharacterized protein n=1 Tax=Hevea brasiliensis TaxID=3981 RepID=A0A6A6MVS7_HEVBR|nr:hypothetical protein GH714_041839 [Hevea brasiliensis]